MQGFAYKCFVWVGNGGRDTPVEVVSYWWLVEWVMPPTQTPFFVSLVLSLVKLASSQVLKTTNYLIVFGFMRRTLSHANTVWEGHHFGSNILYLCHASTNILILSHLHLYVMYIILLHRTTSPHIRNVICLCVCEWVSQKVSQTSTRPLVW